jgi:hypothetical protein
MKVPLLHSYATDTNKPMRPILDGNGVPPHPAHLPPDGHGGGRPRGMAPLEINPIIGSDEQNPPWQPTAPIL